MAAETQINFVYRDPTVSIYTTEDRQAESIKERLEARDADYQHTERDFGEGSHKFEVSKEDIRSPKGIVKAPA